MIGCPASVISLVSAESGGAQDYSKISPEIIFIYFSGNKSGNGHLNFSIAF